MLWSGVETALSTGASLLVSVILARLVAPSAFGVIALLQIFIAVGQSFADAGMTQALIRRRCETPSLERTALALNMGVAALLYMLLWLVAPLIADFYNMEQLIRATRLLALSIPLSALCVVQSARLSVRMQFGTQAKANLSAVLAGGIIGVWLAWHGAGINALIWQQVGTWGVRALILWGISPSLGVGRVNGEDARSLTHFGWKLTAASLIDTVWTNIYAPLVGKCFGLGAAAMFWRADSLARYAPQTLASILGRVGLPAMSHIREERQRATQAYRRLIETSAWLIMPVCAIAAAVAEPLIGWVLTDKWLGAVPYFRVLCCVAALYPLHALNCTALNVWGRSDLFLRLEVIKKCIGLTALLISLPMGVYALCWGMLCSSVVCLMLNMWYARPYTQVGIRSQLALSMPAVVMAAGAAGAAWWVSTLISSQAISLLCSVSLGIAIYVAVSIVTGTPALRNIKNLKLLTHNS